MTNAKLRGTISLSHWHWGMIRAKANEEHISDSIAIERILEEYASLRFKYGDLEQQERKQELTQRQDLRSYEAQKVEA